MAKILVTCVGTGVGQSVIDSLNLIKEHQIVGIDTNRNVYAYHFCDFFFTAPDIYSEGYIDFLIDLSVREKVNLIIPGHDYELYLLSSNIEKFHIKGIEVLVSLPDLIKISRDKYLWHEYFSERGCPIVPTFRVSEFKKNPDPGIFPAVVKPAGGSASQGVSIINTAGKLPEIDDENIIQPYLFPLKDDPNFTTICKFIKANKFVQMSEISIQLIFSTKSELKGIFISKNVLKNGVPIYIDPIQPNEFKYYSDIMAFVPVLIENKVKGPVNIQGRITDKGLVCFEMNMRFTGITGNRAQMGFNEVSYLIKDFLNLPGAELFSYSSNKNGVRQVACTTIPRVFKSNETKLVYTVLGAGSTIGSGFVNELTKTGLYHKIFLICRDSSYEKYLKLFPFENIEIIKLSDRKEEYAYCNSDVVVNFVSALAYAKDPDLFDSIRFQHKQVNKIIKSNVSLVINISSQSVYNQKSDTEKKEDTIVNISNTYAFQKYFAEKMFETINFHAPSVKVVSLRFSRIIGAYSPNTKPSGFFANVIDSLIKNKMVDVPNPKNKINLLDIRDAIGCIMHLIMNTNWKNLPKVMNIGGSNVSIGEYCNKVCEVLNLNDKRKLIRLSDNEEVTCSSMIDCRLANSINWRNQYSLEDTILYISKKLARK